MASWLNPLNWVNGLRDTVIGYALERLTDKYVKSLKNNFKISLMTGEAALHGLELKEPATLYEKMPLLITRLDYGFSSSNTAYAEHFSISHNNLIAEVAIISDLVPILAFG